ncbi:pyruvate dehydrogenase E2 component (dihydrolipoamide acetyltransferase) [Fodinibius roseus]|uniref:Acetyltransferase component of pyruvate dehydrogenase complex n=1 Tax=Fodinibius roseus TaxID=1194090 RepID=A0A1M4YC21_9BACT|nr:pyruvate dehydrogenase complex dihydrolipoamide acetyltransferase [Fodinibius roseus]SHF03219.1 pyruvate dehydrogenase E2 component (dihydrolipoamide acetyltransferase) [Fodinibius roseus]
MAIKVEMPKLSDTMEEGVIAKWNVEEGDNVESGDIIAEVETDKATMEVEVFDAGTILKILASEGDAVPLGQIMAVIGEEGEDISDILKEAESGSESTSGAGKEGTDQKEQEKETPEKEKDDDYDPVFEDSDQGQGKAPASKDTAGNGRIKASPLARRMAEEEGITLANVEGSGPQGRIIKRDIESYEPAEAPAAATVSREDKEVRVSQMRKTIARRLSESKFSNPHYYETISVDMQAVWDARKQINEVSDTKISFNDIVVKACAAALRKHPEINSSWHGDKIVQHGDVNIAVAVAVDEGLLTPVINNTDQKGLEQLQIETRELAEKARERKLQPEEMEGSTFTISNLGMFGIEEFTAIINPPNACILAVGAIKEIPVVEDGEVVPGKRMKMTLSSDHRIVDGAMAAQFLNTLRQMLENPLGIVL